MSIVNQGTILQTRQIDESLQPSIIKGFSIDVSQHTHNVGAGTRSTTEVVPTSGVVGAPRFTAPRAGTGSGFAFRRRRLGGTERAPERRVACAFRECLGRLCVQVRLDVRNLDPALERRDLEQE